MSAMHAFRKAEEGQRSEPRPFAPRATFDPDFAPGTPAYAAAKNVVNGVDRELITRGLQTQMGTDASREPDPPSLRDQIAAAADLHSQET